MIEAGSTGPFPNADPWYSSKRLGGLSRFAVAITLLNILGHTVLGFEQSWITPFAAVATAYGLEFVFETVDAWAFRRPGRYEGGFMNVVTFLLPAHITALAIGMLLFAGANTVAVLFAVAVAVGSKYVIRATVYSTDGKVTRRHVLNPSNFGITVCLTLIPTVGLAPPYQFSENTSGWADWLLPALVIMTGSYLNQRATGRIPLILAWLAAFVGQAFCRYLAGTIGIGAALAPMTGFAFILFTFYMITDPATSPSSAKGQVVFGSSVAVLYALLTELHIVFGMFYALALVTAVRGLLIVGLRHRRLGERDTRG